MEEKKQSRLILATEAAKRLCVGKKQVTLMIMNGEIRGFRISRVGGWRVDEDSLEAYIQNRLAQPELPDGAELPEQSQ